MNKEERLKELEQERQRARTILQDNQATLYRIEGAIAMLQEIMKDNKDK